MATRNIAIFAGQSNLAGSGSAIHAFSNNPHFLSLSSAHQIWNELTSAFETMVIGTNCNTTQYGAQNPFHGTEVNFAYTWNQATSLPIHVIKHAVVGTLGNTRIGPLPIWNKGAKEIYPSFIAQVQAAIASFPDEDTINVVGMFWIQGESDIGAQNALDYYQQLLTLLADVRTDLGIPALPFHVLRLHDKFVPAARQTQVNAVRAAQWQAVTDAADANFTLFDTDDVSYTVYTGNEVHYDNDGLNAIGADLYAHTLLDNPGVGLAVLDADSPWLADVGFQELTIVRKPTS